MIRLLLTITSSCSRTCHRKSDPEDRVAEGEGRDEHLSDTDILSEKCNIGKNHPVFLNSDAQQRHLRDAHKI